MRITVKHQVLLAPATMLIILSLLFGFMQFTYWDLAAKQKEAKKVSTTFIALAEADMAARRLHVLLRSSQHTGIASPEDMALAADLYDHLLDAIERLQPVGTITEAGQIAQILQLGKSLNPANSPPTNKTAKSFARFRTELSALSNQTQSHRNQIRLFNEQDVNQLIKQTALVSMAALVLAIVLGLLISSYFSRRILKRIQLLSENAAKIAAGELELPPAPDHISDELDILAVSIKRMTRRLNRVVGTEKLLEGAEEERRRIAMDLHDQSLSDLSTILRDVQQLSAQQSDSKTLAQTNKLELDLELAIANLREIMNNLHPQTLDILGLGAAIEAHLEQHYLDVKLPTYHLYIDPQIHALNLDKIKQLALYRITIEAIQNVIKHANATRYEVNLELREHQLVLSIEDNGAGMGKNITTHNGHGLNNIRERATSISAQVDWRHSRFFSGTRFELVLTCGPDNC